MKSFDANMAWNYGKKKVVVEPDANEIDALHKSYAKYEASKKHFIAAFQPIICSSQENFPDIVDKLKPCCKHKKNQKLEIKHNDLIIYMQKTIKCADQLMNYTINKHISKSIIPKKLRKISYIHEGDQVSRLCLFFKPPSSNENVIKPIDRKKTSGKTKTSNNSTDKTSKNTK